MKVLHTIAGTRLDHGGTSRSVPSLCEAISQQGVAVEFLTTRPHDRSIPYNLPQPPVVSHTIEESPAFKRILIGHQFRSRLSQIVAAERSGELSGGNNILVHDHGIWLAPNHAVAKFARRSNLIRVVSPRGMMSEWAIGRGRLKKNLAWWTYQHADLKCATAFHVTSQQEAQEVRSLGFAQPIAIIPNGISFPEKTCLDQRNNNIRRMLFLSRIHPKKGLIELVRAWKKANLAGDWELVIAGPNEGNYQQQVEAEIKTLGLNREIKIIGSIDDSAKWQIYADADLFVLPSFSENFGLVIAEALAAGLPVITTTGTPWEELPRRGCGWWVEPTVDSLADAISDAANRTTEQLNEMGAIGAVWVQSTFTWESVAKKMIMFYAWLLENTGRPEYVDTVL